VTSQSLMKGNAPLVAVLLVAACASPPPRTAAPATIVPTSHPSTSAAPSPPVTPMPSSPFAVACGPLGEAACNDVLAVVNARVETMRAEARDLASVTGVSIEPDASMLTCVPDGDLCSVTAVVTFAKPEPFPIGLVLVDGSWSSQGPAEGWWGMDGISYCIPSAWYRVASKVTALGNCTTALFEFLPDAIKLTVGQRMDLHMTTLTSIPPRSRPYYPLPWSTVPSVLAISAASDAATATFSAIAPGVSTLLTVGHCIPKANTPNGIGDEFTGPCPLATVKVTSGK
jgi:hypothetical protein